MSYGIVNADHYRQGATYVDQILRGAKPGNLPVQTPTKYETVLNSKTAKNLGLIVPEALLVAVDEIIEAKNVRYWHLADVAEPQTDVRFRG